MMKTDLRDSSRETRMHRLTVCFLSVQCMLFDPFNLPGQEILQCFDSPVGNGRNPPVFLQHSSYSSSIPFRYSKWYLLKSVTISSSFSYGIFLALKIWAFGRVG